MKGKEQLVVIQSFNLLTNSLLELSSHIPHMVFRMMGLKYLKLHLPGAGSSHIFSQLKI
jgi:hypothetical protein